MSIFKAPVDTLMSVLDTLDYIYPDWNHYLDNDTQSNILKQASRFAEEVLAPLNRLGDIEGAQFQKPSSVIIPEKIHDAYRYFCESGWMGAGSPEEYGGFSIPMPLITALFDIWSGANAAFALLPMLNFGAIETIYRLGSSWLKTCYLPPLIEGKAGAAMVLTEAEAGSDFSALSTRAILAPDIEGEDVYRLTGHKIFITFGDHNLTQNIIHLTLARTSHSPGSPRGLSLFVVPKFLEDGTKNTWKCTSIEHKMGIRSAPAASISYDNAIGYRIGKPGRGLEYFYDMMRLARYFVGVQALALSQHAYISALKYSHTRIQGRIPGDSDNAYLIAHPDVQKMLVTMKCRIDGMRAMIYDVSGAMELVQQKKEEVYKAYVDLLIPVIKAWCTDQSVLIASTTMQLFGGIGYIEDAGISQLFRDARIGPIYEGTNGIQAIDVVVRRTIRDRGSTLDLIIGKIQETGQNFGFSEEIQKWVANSTLSLRNSVNWILDHAKSDTESVLFVATDYTALIGWVIGGWCILKHYNACSSSTVKEKQINSFEYYAKESSLYIAKLTEAILNGVSLRKAANKALLYKNMN